MQKIKQFLKKTPKFWSISIAVITFIGTIMGIIAFLETHPNLTPWIRPTATPILTPSPTATYPPTSTPTFTALPTATMTPTITPQPPPTVTPTLGILVITMPTQARLGSEVTVTIQTLPGMLCEIEFIMPSGGSSTVDELKSKEANEFGICSWTWHLSANMGTGPGKIVIRVGGLVQEYPIEIVS